MIIILNFFYQGQAPKMNPGDDAILAATSGVTNWLCTLKPTNLIIDLVNECNTPEFTQALLKPPPNGRITELIQLVQNSTQACGNRIFTGTSFTGGTVPPQEVIDLSDFILIHGNFQDPNSMTNLVQSVRNLTLKSPKPIVVNEDDHYDFNATSNNCEAVVTSHGSWGYYDACTAEQNGNYIDGYQCPPTNWGINTQRKQDFFNYVQQITTG